MNDEPPVGDVTGRSEAVAPVQKRYEGLLRRARAALLWERAWPLLVPVLMIVAGFLILSWFGLWLALPFALRMVGVGLSGVALVVAMLRIAGRLRLPRRSEAVRRVEAVSGLAHHPLLALEDRLADAHADRATRMLWQAHVKRMARQIDGLSAGLPSPRLDRRDPLALRALVVLLLVVAFLFAGGERWSRIAAAFRQPEAVAVAELRIDAWITPPIHTGRAPVFLTGPNVAATAGASVRHRSVPEGSELVVRVSRKAGITVTAGSGARRWEVPAVAAEGGGQSPDVDGSGEFRLVIRESTEIAVLRDKRRIAGWSLVAEPDAPPRIRALDAPRGLARGALELSYALEDDFGVIAAEAEFALPEANREMADPAAAPRPLYAAPEFALSLPRPRTRAGRGVTVRDLSRHPWAGGDVLLTLVARDDAGQEGRSDRLRFTLPQRPFRDPLARALIHERRRLALDANTARRVADSLDALTLFPERYLPDKGVYLALRVARLRLLKAGDDDALRRVVDLLWDIATGIEDGDLSAAEQALREAEQRLMEALERGASEAEIERLMAELRNALNGFLRELAARAENGARGAEPGAESRVLRPEDFERMLRRMEDLARSGSRDAARQLLSQMQRMLEDLRIGRGMAAPDPQTRQMQEALRELGDMIGRQQELMDRTFRMDPRARPGRREEKSARKGRREKGEAGELRELERRQGALREALGELMRRLEKSGTTPGRGLERAQGDMGRAGQGLARGEPGEAVRDQSSAIENLREGAAALAREIGRRLGGATGRVGEGREGVDPLGRPQRTTGPQFGDSVKVPSEIDAQRARQIVEEIRRRLGQQERIEMERDYLERLLERY